MSQLGLSSSEVVPGGTGKQGMLFHPPKSSRLSPYTPQEAPGALKAGTKKAPVPPCAQSVPTKQQHPTRPAPGW